MNHFIRSPCHRLRPLLWLGRDLKSLRTFLTNNSGPRPARQFIREYRNTWTLLAHSRQPEVLINYQLSRFIRASTRLLARSKSPSKEQPTDKKQEEKSSNKQQQQPPEEDEDPGKDAPPSILPLIVTAVVLGLLWLIPSPDSEDSIIPQVSWNEFVTQMLSTGEVEQIVVKPEIEKVIVYLHDGAIINGRPANRKHYQMTIPGLQNFETKLRKAEESLGIRPENGVPVIYSRNDGEFASLITLGIIALIMMRLLGVRSGVSIKFGGDMMSQFTKAKFKLVDPHSGTASGGGVRFADIAGLKEAKIEINEFVSYLRSPDRYKELGAKVPKGVLLLGPPGCGKTMLAKAVATESEVPCLVMAGSEFIEMIGGLGAARVRSLFAEARKRAPCIVYIDEIDAIGKKRSEGLAAGTGEEEQTLNQLLVEMDGMASREGVLMLASTNRADVLDKALLRPGRFDRHIMIDYPTLIERDEIFQQHLKTIRLEKHPLHYSKRMAQLTPGFSGADIANVCNEAALKAARDQHKDVSGSDLEYAVERVVGGTEKRTHVISVEEKKVVAYHESGHALVGWLLKHTDALLKVTIVPRTKNVLGFAMNLSSDQKLYSTEELFERMCMVLGGRVAESITFNKISTGAQNDLEKVTKMAYGQIRQFGMDPIVGPVSFPSDEELRVGPYIGAKPFSKQLQNTMDIQARILVGKAYMHTEGVLRAHRDKLRTLAEALLQRETLNYDDVVKLIGPPPHGGKKIVDIIDFGSYSEEATKTAEQSNGVAEPRDDQEQRN